MSLVHTSIDQFADFLPPSNKRKLDDYSPVDENDDISDFVASTIRMRKLDSLYSAPSDFHYCKGNNFVNSPQSLHDSKTLICGESSRSHSRLQLQFFVRMISGGSTLVLRLNLNDTVEMVHEKIQSITGIPMVEQRLIYRGKQLQWEQTLADCSIQNDAGLQLVGRMRSTEHPHAWWVINDMVSIICRICKKDSSVSNVRVRALRGKLDDYINKIPNRDNEASDSYSIRVVEYFKVFVDSGAPKALVMLYMSPEKSNKDCADDCIRCFINSVHHLEIPEKEYVATIVLEFSKLLRQVGDDDLLYLFCRNALGSMVATVGDECMRKKIANYYVRCIKMEDILPLFRDLADRLSKDLVLSVESNGNVGPSFSDVTDFSAFLHPVVCLVTRFGGLGKVPVEEALSDDVLSDGEEAKLLLLVYTNLCGQIDQCLQKMEQLLDVKSEGDVETFCSGWSQYLDILKELHGISELHRGTEVKFWAMMTCRKTAVRALIVGYAKHSDDHKWLFDHKDVMDFQSRRHLAMLMFPEVKEDFEELHEMLIDRSHLLAESFEYISRAEPSSLHAGLFMEFKNEEATGPGVLREWFFLVCQAIFNPQNALFVACPHDRRRFFPNPASKVDPMHLKYFRFSGRVVALALMHKLQVGIVLDRVFFLQLAGRDISLEDIKDADPDMYNSCKQILEMDAEFIDSDALGLTFVREVVELGSTKVVELCHGGKSIIVNSSNRGQYISLCIQHCFVKSIREQVNEFAQGFADILCKTALRTSFFQSLELQDLDWMLHGNGSAISVEDWKEHTEYHGYKKSDRQILWFWEVVGQMLDEQKKILLFFWTSLKYLPVEGFHGLASQLFIYKSYEPPDHLPSSHTCFYRLCIPTYPSKTVMEERLCTITREHIGCSFGNW